MPARLGYPVSADGIGAILAAPSPFDVVFDATNAMSHAEHWRLLRPLDTLLIDLTPSRTGQMVVPTVTGTARPGAAQRQPDQLRRPGVDPGRCTRLPAGSRWPTSRSSPPWPAPSPGRATRLNLDEYVATTQHAITAFSGVREAKAILNISPAVPPAIFRTAVHAIIPAATAEAVTAAVDGAAEQVRAFAPGYQIISVAVTGDRVVVSLEVIADSDVLPRYAGNLDIINAAAILVAAQHAARRGPPAAAARAKAAR